MSIIYFVNPTNISSARIKAEILRLCEDKLAPLVSEIPLGRHFRFDEDEIVELWAAVPGYKGLMSICTALQKIIPPTKARYVALVPNRIEKNLSSFVSNGFDRVEQCSFDFGEVSCFRLSDNLPLRIPNKLSPREMEVLLMIAAGYSPEQIERQLQIAQTTYSTFKRAIKLKTGITNDNQFTCFAVKNGLIRID